MARRSEQGNVLGFVLVGALLAALLVGGIYVVRHNIAGKVGNSGTAQAPTQQTNENQQSNASNPDSQGDKAKPAETSSAPSNDQALKDALAAQSAAEKKAKEQQQQQQQSVNNNSNTTSATSPPTPPANTTAGSTNSSTPTIPRTGVSTDELPTTGPEEIVITAMGATLLSGIGFSYVRSRRLI